jgi:hypothetical protein
VSQAPRAEVDTSAWPVVIHRVWGSLSEAAVDAYIEQADAVLARQERHVAILDARQTGSVTAYTRSRSMQWIRLNAEALKAHCVATVYVVESPVVRFIVMTTLLVSRLPTPIRVCSTIDEALTWANQRLGAHR